MSQMFAPSITPPAPAPPAPSMEDPAVLRQLEDDRLRRQTAQGRASTLLTNPSAQRTAEPSRQRMLTGKDDE